MLIFFTYKKSLIIILYTFVRSLLCIYESKKSFFLSFDKISKNGWNFIQNKKFWLLFYLLKKIRIFFHLICSRYKSNLRNLLIRYFSICICKLCLCFHPTICINLNKKKNYSVLVFSNYPISPWWYFWLHFYSNWTFLN